VIDRLFDVTVSNSRQIANSDRGKLRNSQEAVMSDACVFQLFAQEAMRGSANAVSEDEKRALEELAFIWAQAAFMSDRVFGPSFTSLLDFADAVPLSRAN
jgi:hypothetical protein